jgi:membrane protease YdiL (CAAX protease family)
MPLVNMAIKAVVNATLIALLPFGAYCGYHALRHGRSPAEVARRAGLQVGERRYIGYAGLYILGMTLVSGALILWPLPFGEDLGSNPRSPLRPFVGLGLNAQSFAMAVLYGFVSTGFSEELLFRGLIAGVLSRRLSLWWADTWQSLIFVLPHLALVFINPRVAWVLPLVFGQGLFLGWLRIRSGSILGPWAIHAWFNFLAALRAATTVSR